MKGSLRSCSTGLRVRVGFEGCRLFRSFEFIRFALTPNNLPFFKTYTRKSQWGTVNRFYRVEVGLGSGMCYFECRV